MAVPSCAAPTRCRRPDPQYVNAAASVRPPPDGGAERGNDRCPRPAGSLWTAGEQGAWSLRRSPDSPTASPTTEPRPPRIVTRSIARSRPQPPLLAPNLLGTNQHRVVRRRVSCDAGSCRHHGQHAAARAYGTSASDPSDIRGEYIATALSGTAGTRTRSEGPLPGVRPSLSRIRRVHGSRSMTSLIWIRRKSSAVRDVAGSPGQLDPGEEDCEGVGPRRHEALSIGCWCCQQRAGVKP